MILGFVDKLTKKQEIYLWAITIPTFLGLFFNLFGKHYIIGGIAINIVLWSWFTIIIWNNAKEITSKIK